MRYKIKPFITAIVSVEYFFFKVFLKAYNKIKID